MNDWRTVYNGVPFFLTRDEQAQVALLCNHVMAGECDQVLVSGASGQRVYMVGSIEIESRLGKDWSIDVIDDRTEDGLISYLMKFAQDIRAERTRKRIRFVPTAPKYLGKFLADLDAPCSLGYFEMGFDARTQERFTREFVALLTAWRKRVSGSVYHFEGIVDAGDNNFLFDTQRELRRALDAGDAPTDLFLAALEMRDG